jgi:hypothetical protein
LQRMPAHLATPAAARRCRFPPPPPSLSRRHCRLPLPAPAPRINSGHITRCPLPEPEISGPKPEVPGPALPDV